VRLRLIARFLSKIVLFYGYFRVTSIFSTCYCKNKAKPTKFTRDVYKFRTKFVLETSKQGCDSRTHGNHARGLKNSLHAVFTRYSRGNHVRYIYGNILKYTVNTGESVFFLVVGGRGGWCLQVSCVVRLPFSLFSLSLFAPFPPALCVRLQLQCSSPWTMVVCAYRQVRNAKCY